MGLEQFPIPIPDPVGPGSGPAVTGGSPGARELVVQALWTVVRRPVLLVLFLVLGAASGYVRALGLAAPVADVFVWSTVPVGIVALIVIVLCCRYVALDRTGETSTLRAEVRRSLAVVPRLVVAVLVVAGIAGGVLYALSTLEPPLVVRAGAVGLVALLGIHLPMLVPAATVDDVGPIAAAVAAWRIARESWYRIGSIYLLVGVPTVVAYWSLGSFYLPAFAVVAAILGLLEGTGLVAFSLLYVESVRGE